MRATISQRELSGALTLPLAAIAHEGGRLSEAPVVSAESVQRFRRLLQRLDGSLSKLLEAEDTHDVRPQSIQDVFEELQSRIRHRRELRRIGA